MSRKKRRARRAQDRPKITIWLRGRSCTVDEASALALQAYQHGHFQDALDIYQLILAKFPDHADICNNQGVALQNLQRWEDALASYDKAIALKSNCVTFHCNRAATLQALNRYDEALASYGRVIGLQPDLAMAYNNRGFILYKLCRQDEALADYDKVIALQPDCADAYNNRCNILRQMGRHTEALASCDRAIGLKADHAEAFNNRGVVLKDLHRHSEAVASFDKAIELKPYYAAPYNNRGISLKELKRYDEALLSYDKAIELKPNYAEAYNNRCVVLLEQKLYTEALASCEKAIELEPDHAEAYQNRGIILTDTGKIQEAESMFRKALSLKPDLLNPWYSLTVIRRYRDADHADVKRIKGLLSKSSASLRDRDLLYFALGKIYDDCGLYDDAFESYRQGNQICNAEIVYNPGGITDIDNDVIEVFSKDLLAQPFSFASDSNSPVFIVGMPRSGTTLMASILSNHQSIGTAGELTTMIDFSKHLPEWIGNGMPYPQAAKHITLAIARRMIQEYENRLRRDNTSSKPYIIDKYPLNFRSLGLISMLFPRARIIHCMRHPLDTCLSNYFQRFALDYTYAFDLRNIGHYYREYERLMAHWRQALPMPMIEIRYEDIIVDTESAARRMLDFLELGWDERCLSPHTNPCAVETSSKWQVRQPIYRQAVERWRHYDKHLAALKDILGLK